MYVLAGKVERDLNLDSIEKYDIKTKRWVETGFKTVRASKQACRQVNKLV